MSARIAARNYLILLAVVGGLLAGSAGPALARNPGIFGPGTAFLPDESTAPAPQPGGGRPPRPDDSSSGGGFDWRPIVDGLLRPPVQRPPVYNPRSIGRGPIINGPVIRRRLSPVRPIRPRPNSLPTRVSVPGNSLPVLTKNSPPANDPFPNGIRAKLDLKKKGGSQGDNFGRKAFAATNSPASKAQEKALDGSLGYQEALIDVIAAGVLTNPADLDQYKKAMEAAKQGDSKPLKDFLANYKNNPNANPKFVDQLDVYVKTQELKQDAAAGKPLDNVKLAALDAAITKLGPGPWQDKLKTTKDQVAALNPLVPPKPAGSGGPGLPGTPGGPIPGYPVPPGYPVLPGAYPVAGASPSADGYPGVYDNPPVADAQSESAPADVVVMNPSENDATVRYVINNQSHELAPGQEPHRFNLPSNSNWTIAFDRGVGQGRDRNKRYKLTKGTFRFRVTEDGWELFKKRFKLTIDNSDLSADFAFLLDGKEQRVPAGESLTFTSIYPMEIVFDRGNGGKEARKVLEDGFFKVGIDANNTALDLFAAN